MNCFKKNKGATLTDVVIAIIIFAIFMGVLTTTTIKIFKHNVSIGIDAAVVDCSVKICEYIDEIRYEDVNENLKNNIKNLIEEKYNQEYDFEAPYNISLNIEDYNGDGSSNINIMKIVNINIEYDSMDETKTYRVKKLKIKEI